MFMYKACVLACIVFLNSHAFCAVNGTVTNTGGSPVIRALVTFIDKSESDNQFRGYTDEKGNYTITILSRVQQDNPNGFQLRQNYPNPFNPWTTIPYTLEKTGHVTITVYNIMGQQVRTIVDSYQTYGTHSVIWDGRDDNGKSVGAGIYIYQIRSDSQVQSRKMLLLDGGGSPGNSTFTSRNSADAVTLPGAVKKPADVRFKVKIISKDSLPFEEDGLTLIDGSTYDFVVHEKEHDILGITFVSLAGGEFLMGGVLGGLPDYCGPVHPVTVSPFEISAFEITNEQYMTYLNDALASGDILVMSGSVRGLSGDNRGKEYLYLDGSSGSFPCNECWIRYSNGTFTVEPGYENWPVVWVTWYGAKALAEYYGFDLPTEAEWEYAAQIGEKYYIYSTYDETISIDRVNYLYSKIEHPVDIGSYPSSPFGLYDMTGNVWEWCSNWFEPYNGEIVIDPSGPLTGIQRVARGGSWNSFEEDCLVFNRSPNKPETRSYDIGFRVVRR